MNNNIREKNDSHKEQLDWSEQNTTDYINQMLSTFIDNIEIGLYVSDYYTGEILFANRKVKAYTEFLYKTKEVTGKHCWDLFNITPEGRCSYCPYKHIIDENENSTGIYKWEHYFPKIRTWFKILNQAIIWPDGRLAHMVTFYDITDTKNAHEQLANLAFVNQHLQLNNEIKLDHDMKNTHKRPSLIMFDISSLHKVNDAYGREIGDNLLRAIRDWIFEQNIPHSNLYRIGGDEFCITVEHMSPVSVRALADSIVQRFASPWIFDNSGNKLNIFSNISLGVILSDYVRNGESLLNLIDRTLNEAKRRKQTVIYDEAMDADFKRRLSLELNLKNNVRDGMVGFEVNYQPIADPTTGFWCGLEALCRWYNDELGLVPPNTFIPEAERLSLIGQIGLWVLETAITHCKKWGLDKFKNFVLNVNLSAIQFSDELLSHNVLKILHDHDYPSEKLCVEITESTQFTFTNLSLNIIQELRANNILVALDDFGTGYANFGNLRNLPIDILKIERDFVADIETNDYHKHILQAMTEIAHKAGMKLVAEGVESNSQKEMLLQCKADYLQGYLYSKPITTEMFEQMLYHFKD